MTVLRRGRILYWIARELSQKYTKALLGGFIVGLFATLLLGQLYPFLLARYLTPIERIGVVGDFTPSNLPASIQQLISFGLTTVGEDGAAYPGLAQNWEISDDGKTYTFHLRNDIVWHDGKPVTAYDVNYNIRNVSFQAIDAHTLKIGLHEPYSPFPTIVSKPLFGKGLKGFGSYRVDGIKLRGDVVEYVRLLPIENDTGKRPLEYRFYRTEALAITAFKLGHIDKIEDITNVAELKGWGKTVITERIRHDRMVALFFNTKNQLLGERSLRQMLGYAMPRIDEERAYSPISVRSWAYNDTVRQYTQDMDHAKRLLSQSAIASDSASITITTFAQYVDVATDIAAAWNELGVLTTVKVENSLGPEYDVLLSAQDVPPDPDQYPLWHSTQAQTNITGYASVKVDKLLEDGRTEMDRERRKKLYLDFQRFLVEDAPAIFLFYPKLYTVTRAGE